MLDLSIIIPIYNTPIEDLSRCFASILPLEQLSYEVLLIDDGSAAQVGDFCKAFVSQHQFFQYHYKENGGVSSARNLGLSLASGKYLTFVDADDVICADTLSVHFPTDSTPDLVLFDMILTQLEKDSMWYAFDLPEGTLSQEQVLYQLLTASSISGPVAKLYLTARIREANLCFDTRFIAGEDWMFVCDYTTRSRDFLYCRKPSYRYFRDNSTGQGRMIRFPDTMLHNQLARYARKQELLDNFSWKSCDPVQISSLAAAELIENLFNSAAVLLLAKQYTRERKETIRSAVIDAGKQLLPHTSKKTRLKLWVIKSCPILLHALALLRALYLKFK